MTPGQPNAVWKPRLVAAARKGGAVAPAGSSAELHDWIEDFRDEMGHRTDAVVPLLCWITGVTSFPPDPSAEPDAQLWWCLLDPSRPVHPWLSPSHDGPLLAQPADIAQEIWTERELCALHALWWLARTRNEPAWRERCRRAVGWLVGNIQPDNATGHPWSAHVFARCAADPGFGPEAELYAQTLLHNCQVLLGRPDRVSAFILADAARELEQP